MAGAVFLLALDGEKALLKTLATLPDKVQKRIVPAAMKTGLREIVRPEMLRVLAAGPPLPGVKSGKLLAAMSAVKLKQEGRKGLTRVGYLLPERELLGIDPKSKDYYPAFVEYGHGSTPAYSYIRKPLDQNANRVFRLLAGAIGRGITREAKKLAKARGR